MNWEENLESAARSLGARLERPAPPVRRRLRTLPIAGGLAAVAVAALLAAWPRPRPDPVAPIAAEYAEAFRLEALLDQSSWDPEARRAFTEAMSRIDRAIEASHEALRRDPANPVHAELCHLAYDAKARLIRSYRR